MTRIRPILAALATATFLIVSSWILTVAAPHPQVRPAAASVVIDTSAQWRALAVTALDKFESVDHTAIGGSPGALTTGTGCTPSTHVPRWVSTYAWAGEASGRLRGWTDPKTVAYLNAVLAMKNPDGGYGFPCAYDQFNDGTLNPATTSYTVVMAGHVGSFFLADYAATHDPVVGDEIHDIVLRIKATHQLNTAAGTCIAYTDTADDRKSAGYCVHNVNAGAVDFMLKAAALGIGTSGTATLAQNVTRRETAAWSIYTNDWPYQDTPRASDPDHTSYEVESIYALAPQLAANVGFAMMHATPSTDPPGNQQNWLVHVRLAWLPDNIGGYPGTPGRWCGYAGPYEAEAATAVAGLVTAVDLLRLSQAAQMLARASDACEVFDTVPEPSPSAS